MLAAHNILELVGGSRVPPAGAAPAPALTGRRTPGAGGPLAIAGGAYDGAKIFDREMLRWQPSIRSADGDLLADKLMLDTRGRDVSRNDAFVGNASRIQQDSIVGSRFMLSAKPDASVLGINDPTWEKEFQEEAEAKFSFWAESEDCWADAGGKLSFTDMARLAVGLDAIGGEILASVEWIRDRDPRRLWNTAINFVDPDRLSNPNGMWNSANLRNGVERDDFGRPIAYNFRRVHPGDPWAFTDTFIWDRVLATKPWGRKQVLHFFETLRPDQSRGVSTMVAALKEMRMTHKFRDITLQNAVVNATYAATIESELPSEAVFAALGQGAPRDMGLFAGQYADSYLAAIAQYVANKEGAMQLDGVKIPHLYPGTKLQMRPAGTPGGVGTEFEDSLLRYISASLGVGYEEFTHNYSQTNYSSIQAAATSIRRGQVARKRRTADRFANCVYKLWLEESISKGLIDAMPRNAPIFQVGINGDAYAGAEWIGASMGQVDQLKETQAAMLRVQNGLSTYQVELSRFGMEWRGAFKQMASEMEFLKKLDLWDALRVGTVTTRDTNTTNALQAGAEPTDAGDGTSKKTDPAK